VHGRRTPRAFVLFHGLTNSPYQFRDLTDSIYNAGDNVFVPRLPWHALPGGRQRELARITATELRDVADASVDIASGLGDTVIVFGLSLGGTMAAWVAQFRPVDRVVIAAPALGVSHVTSVLETPMMNLGLRLPNYSHDDPPDPLRPDRMPGWCSRGIAEMMALGLAHPPFACWSTRTTKRSIVRSSTISSRHGGRRTLASRRMSCLTHCVCRTTSWTRRNLERNQLSRSQRSSRCCIARPERA
jgi:pimeloyl-ACP methyl ester carboxylesterase